MAEQELDKLLRAFVGFNDYRESGTAGPSHYPFNVLHNEDRKRLVEASFRHYKKYRAKILLDLNLPVLAQPTSSITSAEMKRRYDLQRSRANRLNLPIYDYDDHNDCDDELKRYSISFKDLTKTLEQLHWPIPVSWEQTAAALTTQGPPQAQPKPSNSTVQFSQPLQVASLGTRLPTTYLKDPKCRFVLLETASSSIHRLEISEDLLFLMLTYHQVAPTYLDFITSFSSQTMSSDLRFGGFRCQTALTHGDSRAIPPLGRSGLHFQLSFKLRTILEGEPNDKASLEKPNWRRPQAAIYHHFDVVEGKSFWIINAPRRSSGSNNGGQNVLWNQIRASISANKQGDVVRAASHSHKERLAAALDVLLTIAEWSLGDFSFYLQHIEEELSYLMDPYLEDAHLPWAVPTRVFQVRNHWIQQLSHCDIKLSSNIRVLKNLVQLYCTLAEATNHLPQCAWVAECAGDIEIFKKQMTQIIDETTDIQTRAGLLRQQATNTEDFIQKLLQHQQTNYVSFLAEISSDESVLMRVFQTITLVLLPMTVVSTVFSTDFMKHYTVNDETPWKGAVVLFPSMLGLCLVVFFWFKWLKRHAIVLLSQKRAKAMRGDHASEVEI